LRIREDIILGQHSHVGMARTANEDFFGYWEPDDDRQFDLKGRLVVVCDGMGGHAGGEIASRLAVKTIIDTYSADPSDNIMEALRKAIELANSAVFNEHRKPKLEKLKGMGTTVTAVVHRRDMVYFGQVGDSRAYLIRGQAIQQMTKDHSLVQQLVDEGLLEESEMENHPDKNVILRSLGVKSEVEVDISYAPLAMGDTYLICSDGLSGLVSSEEMLQIVSAGHANGGDMRGSCEKLVDLANQYGGHDNITVQLLHVKSVDGGVTDTTSAETVTQSFTPDEVAASIAAAKAQAAADGKTPTPPGAPAPNESGLPSPAIAAAPDMPSTQPSMPVATLSSPPPKSGGGGLFLVFGLLLGMGLGAGGLFGLMAAEVIPSPAASEASDDDDSSSSSSGPSKKDLQSARELRANAKEKATRAQAPQLAKATFDVANSAAEEDDSSIPDLLTAADAFLRAAEQAKVEFRNRQASESRGEAVAARDEAGDAADERLAGLGKDEFDLGEAALTDKRFEDALKHFHTAQAFYRAAAGGGE
jgi:serine/threonine protein phosphatase PrpC